MNKRILANFKYFAPTFKNNVVYLAMLVVFLPWLHFYGDSAWNWVMTKWTIPQFFIFGGFGFYFIFFWILAAGYLHLYYRRSPKWLYQYKIQDHGADAGHRVPIAKSIGLVLFNQFFGTLPYLIGVVYFLLWRGYADTIQVPAWWVSLLHIVAMILFQDLFFYLNHLLMHRNKFLYKNVHALHHQYRESIAIATHYVHYVEHLIGNLFPVFIGAMIFMPHPWVFMFWIVLIAINALHNHSGFAFPYLSYSVHHDWHHYYVNSSYSSIGLCDKIFKTDAPFEEMIDLKTSKPTT
jgi:sterol desaturase/sphingolipid hydroxylase (fatty acid hydroxylase superfamily)